MIRFNIEIAATSCTPYFREGVMPMGFERLFSLLGLLIATASLALDLIVFVIGSKKRKRPRRKGSHFKD